MKFQFLLLLFFLMLKNSGLSYAQDSDKNRLFDEASEIRFSEPNKSLKLYDYLLKSSNDKEAVAIEIKRLQINRYLGHYEEAVEISQSIKDRIDQFSDSALEFEYWNELTALYLDLELKTEGEKILKKAQQTYNQLPAEVQNEYAVDLDLITLEYRENERPENKIQGLKSILNHLKNNDERILFLQYQIGTLYYPLNQDSARVYFDRILEADSSSSIYQSAKVFTHLLVAKKLGDSLMELLSKDGSINKELQLILLNNKIKIWEQKSNIDSLVKYQLMLQETKKHMSFESRRAKVTLLQDIYQQKKIDANSKRELGKRQVWSRIAILGLFLLTYGGYKLYPKKKRTEASNEETSKSIVIPDRTEVEILAKLKKFENSELFLDKQLRIASLAKQLDTNTRYLSSIINSAKDKSFNSYINSLRIHYIVDKLHSDPKYLTYKISYLAEESGFASQSSFTTAFKEVTGMTPSSFIKKLLADSNHSIE